ncbi:TAT-variant-translocated molybdopterin oxidoreductase [Hyalangium gracile]|uniref:TAT-variant-translocated molybdopterin oxidoreductase n=1 Tax=Hyalangium gracile TaxID=394092 RepID=UPI001CCE5EA8|nr:TAT-variant-translocated molybdopterin oxidoreductase [Hyalangium gracile]
MSDESKQYWLSLEQRAGEAAVLEKARDEFPETLPVGVAAVPPDKSSRRDFFKVMGLSAAAAMTACQRAPVQKVIPFVAPPEEQSPGLSLWYASTCAGCSAGCGVLVKARDGRPIKIEGNEEHPLSRGGVCATGQASVLSLYDASRARGPSTGGAGTSWKALDTAVTGALRKVAEEGKAIRLVLPWRLGPTEEAAVKRFLAAYPTARVVRYEALGELEALAEAQEITHGVRAVPDFRFDRATVIASFGADFLGTWVSPVAFTRQYTEARDAAGRREMARHWQFEPLMSLTGASADRRVPLAPSEFVPALGGLVRRLAAKAGQTLPGIDGLPAPKIDAAKLDELAEALWTARERGLVVCGGDDVAAQVLASVANALLGNEGSTVSLAESVALEEGTQGFGALLDELKAGTVGAVLFHRVNPAYSHPRGKELAELLKGVAVTVAMGDRLDETASLASHHAPDHDPLESWGDAEPRRGVLSLRQPVVAPLFETRSAVESLLAWAGTPQGYYELLRARWEAEVFPSAASAGQSFQAFWDDAVRRGVVTYAAKAQALSPGFRTEGLAQALARVSPPGGELELVLYPKVALRDGTLANNGWLQEMPDPISKVTWGNYVCIAPSRAEKLGIQDGMVVQVRVGERMLEAPALVQAGTHPDVLGIAVGYGRTKAGKVADGVGSNAFTLAAVVDGRVRRTVGGAKLTVTTDRRPLALTQTHHTLEGRSHVREAELAAFLANPRAGNEAHGGHGGKHSLSLWSGHEYKGHRWGLAVDLSACTGCSACVVSCQAENNIPIVGQDEALRRREMHWMRIDRYYAGEPDNPQVVHQPMMCQHCENAPCETVCPVLATVHSSEGLNQQVYNRCVGTRYCANNCPTKVRRFNWFDYKHDEPLERMVLNPDVVVRSRGVMEKCSLCVQRIQEGKATARREGREPRDGEIRTACQQSCPAQAIHFGDLNDPESEVARLARDGRAFRLLEELNIGPVVTYLTKIRNTGSGSGS